MNYNNYLAIDTSSRHLTVLAQKGEKTALRFIEDCALSHSVMLMDEIDAALSEIDLTPAECDFFCAVTGPGSFTGIRIGIAAAKGLAAGANKKLLGVTAFDLIAYNVQSQEFCTCIDAAHGHYYVAAYSNGSCNISPSYMSEEELIGLGLPIYGFENLSLKNYTKLQAKNLLQTAICRIQRPLTDDIAALYVRKSQAEEERK